MKKIIFGLIACGLFSIFESSSKDYDWEDITTLINKQNLSKILNQYELIVDEAKDNVRKFERESKKENKDFAYLLEESNRLKRDIERRINTLRNFQINIRKLNIQKKINDLKNFNIDDLKVNLSDLEKRLQNELGNDNPNPQNQRVNISQKSINRKEISSFEKDLNVFFITLQKEEIKLNTILKLGHKLFDDIKRRDLFISQEDSQDEEKRLSFLIYQSRYPEAFRIWNNEVKNIRGEKGFEPIKNMKKENKNKLKKLLEKIQYLHQDVSNLIKLGRRKTRS